MVREKAGEFLKRLPKEEDRKLWMVILSEIDSSDPKKLKDRVQRLAHQAQDFGGTMSICLEKAKYGLAGSHI